MNIPTAAALEPVIKDFLVSNTPYYFFKKLRSSSVPSTLSGSSAPAELGTLFEALTSKKDKSASEAALAYACIFALAQMDHPEARSTLQAIPVHRLDWGIDLRTICLAKLTPEVRQRIEIGEFPLAMTPHLPLASTSNAHILPIRIEQRPG